MKRKIILLFAILLSLHARSQNDNLTKSDSVIFKAMHDEMNRSMKEYSHPDAGKFFYIMYQIEDVQNVIVSAELGSITESDKNDHRGWGYRIMFGDYNCNDENFESSSNGYDLFGAKRTEFPLGDDYTGLRRSLWSITEMAFKSCVKNYLDKLAFYKENPQKKPNLPDFTKMDSVKFLKKSNISLIDQSKAEDLARKVSMVFRNYDKIDQSEVNFDQIKTNVYMLSTEGRMCKLPLDYSILTISAGISNDTMKDQSVYESMFFFEEDPNNFMAKTDKIISSAKNLAEYVLDINDADELTENYTGPVIFSGQASASFFNQALFKNDNMICSEREPVSADSKHNSQKQNKPSKEEKLGKKLIPSEFSVFCKPKLEQYDNKMLLGTDYIDQEGVIPPDEIMLIQNGVLKTFLHTRVPTDSISVSNGHRRFCVSNTGTYSKTAPSNLFVTYSGGKEESTLKSDLIELCKTNGLDYGIEIKCLDENADASPYIYYKVDLKGNEKMIKPLSYPDIEFKTLNKVKECTSKTTVNNRLLNSGTDYFDVSVKHNLSGCFVSYIVPSSVLLNSIEIKSSN